MKMRFAIAAFAVALLSGCAGADSGDVARSGNGPSPAPSTSQGQAASTGATNDGEASVAPATSSKLNIHGKVQVPDGEDGELSVVVVGKPDPQAGSVPVIVRNRTPEPLSGIEVTGTTRDAAGKLIGSGSSQGFAPELLGPGEWAVGYVYFDGAKLTSETKYDLTATGTAPDESGGSVDVEIVEVSATAGTYSDQLVGIVKNATDSEVSGPISVMVGCFDNSGSLESTQSGFAESDPLAAGGTSSFSVDLFDGPCKNWAVGASGYDF